MLLLVKFQTSADQIVMFVRSDIIRPDIYVMINCPEMIGILSFYTDHLLWTTRLSSIDPDDIISYDSEM